MAFLDNSGDIILDAVLTDTGRKRLARGDGSFRITKFCLHDDEIDYGLYNKSHASGSAYYDLEILQTPILEAFTNNTSGMKHKLINISRTNLFYLPEMIIHTGSGGSGNSSVYGALGNPQVTKQFTDVAGGATNTFYIAVDNDTLDKIRDAGLGNTNLNANTALADDPGFLNGTDTCGNSSQGDINHAIEIHQGLDTANKTNSIKIDPSLEETQFIIEMDNRLGSLVDIGLSGQNINPTFIDDDNIASYFITNTITGFQSMSPETNNGSDHATPAYSQLLGPRGSAICFKIKASLELRSSTYLFNLIGSSADIKTVGDGGTNLTTYKIIDSIVRITGGTTGYSLEIPVRYVKYA